MPQHCRVCIHPDVEAMNTQLADGDSPGRIAERFGLTRSSVRRHKDAHFTLAVMRVMYQREQRARQRRKRAEDGWTCEVCGNFLDELDDGLIVQGPLHKADWNRSRRSDTRYCSPACKQKAYRQRKAEQSR